MKKKNQTPCFKLILVSFGLLILSSCSQDGGNTAFSEVDTIQAGICMMTIIAAAITISRRVKTAS